MKTTLALAMLLVCPGLRCRALAQPAPIKPDVLYSFACCDGPISGLIEVGRGILFGAAYIGKPGQGAVFYLPAGPGGFTEKVLYHFDSDFNPNGVIFAGGALYGTTYQGTRDGGSEYGAAFELTRPATGTSWTQTILHNFTGGADGSNPTSNLVMGKNGRFYGTTSKGGANGAGTVYVLAPPSSGGGAWTETVLYAFTGASDGGSPLGPLTVGENGALYGTASAGANPACSPAGCGTVFELAPPGTAGGAWKLTTLHAFTGGADGYAPSAGLAMGANRVLYGATPYGGAGICADIDQYVGCGTVFQLTPPPAAGGGWTEAILHTFTGGDGDGANPAGAVAVGSNKAIFSTTFSGGSSNLGTVYELTPPIKAGGVWAESLYSFTGMNGDGASPTSGLIVGGGGVLIGTTNGGGTLLGGTAYEIVF